MDQPVTPQDESHDIDPTTARRTSRALLRMGAVAVFVALGSVAWIVHARHRADTALSLQTESDQVLAVATARPDSDGAATELVLPGNLQADYEAPIYARTSGY